MLLSQVTTFKLGGPAKEFITVDSTRALTSALDTAERILILGGGSNILFGDEGFDGRIIKINIPGIEREEDVLIAGAGEDWDLLVEHSIQNGLWGIENLSGIPGTVGGAVAGSIGAYGQAIAQTLQWVEVLHEGTIKKLNAQECRFGYRESLFTHERDARVIVRAAFALSQTPKPQLSYKDLQGKELHTLSEIREAVLVIRKSKFPDLSVEGTAGSFFKNPVLNKEDAKKLMSQYPDMPAFALPESAGVKIPLAWLLDHVLHLNGKRIGGARLFEKQPLVVVADRGASAADVKKLVAFVSDIVKEKFSLEITSEVRII